MLNKIYNIFEVILGESKQKGFSSDNNQYQFNCPWCGEENGGEPDGKYNLEINLGLGKFHCWKCEAKGRLSYLIKKWGNKSYLTEYYSWVKELKESGLYDISFFEDNGEGNILEDDGEFLKLPKTFTPLNIKTCRKRKLLDFLKKRNISEDLINFYKMGYTTFDEDDFRMRNRLIIPSYDSMGYLNYWVGRDFSGYEKAIPYKNAQADKKDIVFQESNINWDATIYICEGVLDCIRYPNTISLLGKVLTRDSEIFKKLYEKANGDIVICLDGDTKIEETKRIYSLLNTGRLRGKIKYIRLGTNDIPEKDFSEIYEKYGKEGMIRAFKNERKFSEIELLI